jgi:hypothetical protein
MNPQLKSMLDELVGKARGMLEQHGYLLPVCFIFSDGGFDIVGCPWHNDEEKEVTIIMLRGMAREKNASAVAMLAEAWHATLPGMSLDSWDGTPASKMKNRREVVQVYVEEQDGYWFGLAPITRDKGRPTFAELEWHPLPERNVIERFQKILA